MENPWKPSGKHSQFAIENGPVEIVDLPSYKMVDRSIVMLVYQRVLQMLRSMSFTDSFSDHSSLQFTQVAIHLDILEWVWEEFERLDSPTFGLVFTTWFPDVDFPLETPQA